MANFEVGIIGAGIHGASAAYHLGARGVKTIIFDKGGPASGPTGRSSAVCRAYYTNEFLARVAHESIEMMADFAKYTDEGDSGFHRTGALFLHGPEDERQLRETIPRLNRVGVKTELLDAARLGERFPQFNLDGLAFGAWEVGGGYADPTGTTQGLYRQALRTGVTPKLYTKIRTIKKQPRGGTLLEDEQGNRYNCDRLLIAAGPWTKPLAQQVGVSLPLTVERHIVATFGWGGCPKIPFPFADLPGGYYGKPEGEALFGAGPLHEAPQADPDDFAEEVSGDESLGIIESVVHRVPSLEEAEARSGWASLYDVSPDWQPIVAEVAPGVFVDAGTSGHGFKLGAAWGRHIADLVSGKKTDPGLAQFHPRRFADGHELAAGYGAIKILG